MSCESRPALNNRTQDLIRPTTTFNPKTKEYSFALKWERSSLLSLPNKLVVNEVIERHDDKNDNHKQVENAVAGAKQSNGQRPQY